jgi:hypothetical protein
MMGWITSYANFVRTYSEPCIIRIAALPQFRLDFAGGGGIYPPR